jgi:hypothetical protein
MANFSYENFHWMNSTAAAGNEDISRKIGGAGINAGVAAFVHGTDTS